MAGLASIVERTKERLTRYGVAPVEGSQLLSKVVSEDVEVADRAKCIGEPVELCSQPLGPVGVHHRSDHPQRRAEPPNGDAHIVNAFRIATDPNTRIAGREPVELRSDVDAEKIGGERMGD